MATECDSQHACGPPAGALCLRAADSANTCTSVPRAAAGESGSPGDGPAANGSSLLCPVGFLALGVARGLGCRCAPHARAAVGLTILPHERLEGFHWERGQKAATVARSLGFFIQSLIHSVITEHLPRARQFRSPGARTGQMAPSPALTPGAGEGPRAANVESGVRCSRHAVLRPGHRGRVNGAGGGQAGGRASPQRG